MAEHNSLKRDEELARLRRRLKAVLSNRESCIGIASALADWQSQGWGPVLFGGFLRDLMVFGAKKKFVTSIS
jgi:hypothetical protein